MFDPESSEGETKTADAAASLGVPSRRSGACVVTLNMLRQRLADREMAAPVEDAEPVARVAVEAVGRLGSVDWSELDGGEVLSTVLELEEARRSLDAAIAAGMARVDASGASVAATGLVAHGWLAASTRGSRAAASRDVRLGRLLGRFGGFADAIAAGSLSIDHAVALDAVCNPRNIDVLVAAEAELLAMAYTSTFEAFRRDLRVVAARADVDGPEPDCCEVDTVSASTGAGGEFHLRGRFSGHNAVVMERALRDELDRQWRAAVREQALTGRALPSSGVLRARALAELVRRGVASDPATATAPRTEAILEVRHDERGRAGCAASTASPSTTAPQRCSPATHGSSRSSSTPPPAPRCSPDAPSATPPPHSVGRSSSATAAACSPAVTPRPAGATPITSCAGRTAARPTSTTSLSCAERITGSPTPPNGRSRPCPSTGRDPTRRRPEQSTSSGAPPTAAPSTRRPPGPDPARPQPHHAPAEGDQQRPEPPNTCVQYGVPDADRTTPTPRCSTLPDNTLARWPVDPIHADITRATSG